MNSDPYTINLGEITQDYSMTASDTITLDNYSSVYTSSSSDTITLTVDGTGMNAGIAGWFEDQNIVNEYREEKEIRERNAGVQAAWEQYKIMVALAKEPPENLDNLV